MQTITVISLLPTLPTIINMFAGITLSTLNAPKEMVFAIQNNPLIMVIMSAAMIMAFYVSFGASLVGCHFLIKKLKILDKMRGVF